MAARLPVLALVAALALILGACGQTSEDSAKDFQGEQRAVADAVEDFQDAGRKGDGDKICDDLLTPALVAAIRKASGPCDNALDDRLSDADVFGLDVTSVTIDGTSATAVVESDGGDPERRDTLTLQRVGSAWKIAGLG